MATVASSHRLFYTENNFFSAKGTYIYIVYIYKTNFFFSPIHLILILFLHLLCVGKKEHVSYDAITPPIKRNMWKGETGSTLDEIMLEASLLLRKQKGLQRPSINRSPQKEKYCIVPKAMSAAEKHLNSLNSYLGKLYDDAKQPSLKILNQRTESNGKIDELKAYNGLRSLENYLDKVKGGNKLHHEKHSCLALITRSCS